MPRNFKLIIEYDGTSYNGWQRQKNGRTIQGEIEKALATMTGKGITVTGSGRTDAGVHAFGQAANFLCDTKLSPDAFLNGLNSLLPEDIVIRKCSEVDEKFHARISAKSKIYHYRILNSSRPAAVCRQYVWFIREKLDPDAMRRSIVQIVGTHDFKAFEAAGSPRLNTIRCVKNASLLKKDNNCLIFEIEADGFLRFMVRNIVGTLVEVGRGKITPDDFKEILLARDRCLAGPTAPPQGLFLMQVRY